MKGLVEPTRGRVERTGRGGAAAAEPRRLPAARARRGGGRARRACAARGSRAAARPTRATSPAASASAWRSRSCSPGAPAAAVLLDEPTRGMDRAHKDALARRCSELAARRRRGGGGHARHRVRGHVRRPRGAARPGRGDRRRLARARCSAAAGTSRPTWRASPTARRSRPRRAPACCATGSRGRWHELGALVVRAARARRGGGLAWYERERPSSRVLALVAALAALAVVGRLAFAAIPNVKPTTDIVLFAGYALGAAPGFAVGAITALVSNVFLSQGPWTVWQMAGWGAVGVGGRAARAGHARARAEPARGSPLVCGARRARLRRLDGPLPVDARRPAGPRLVPRDRRPARCRTTSRTRSGTWASRS